MRLASASRNSRSASAWCWSRWLRSAIQALLSTNRLGGAAAAGAVGGRRLGNEGLVEITLEAGAQVGREAVDVPAEAEQRVVGRLARQRPDCDADGLGLGPSTRKRPRFEPLEILVVQIDLQRPGHDFRRYLIMI